MLFIECAICFTVYVVNASLESSWMVRAQIDLSHVIVTVDFITVILSLNDHLKYRNFITQKTLTIIIVHLHSNIDSLVQRNCLVLYFDKEVFIFYNIIYSAVKQSKQCNERNKHSWYREVVQEFCGESSAVVVILWLYGLQTELMFVIVLLSNLYIWKQWKMGEFFYTWNLSFDKLLK